MALSPGLCPDWETWDPSQPVENAREAMQQADDWLGVPQVTIACATPINCKIVYSRQSKSALLQ